MINVVAEVASLDCDGLLKLKRLPIYLKRILTRANLRLCRTTKDRQNRKQDDRQTKLHPPSPVFSKLDLATFQRPS